MKLQAEAIKKRVKTEYNRRRKAAAKKLPPVGKGRLSHQITLLVDVLVETLVEEINNRIEEATRADRRGVGDP